MSETIRFKVPGDPVGKERPRFAGAGRSPYTPAKTRAYERLVELTFLQQLRTRGWRALPSSAMRVVVDCRFRTGTHPDPDNVLKLVLDALTAGWMAYKNDRHVSSSVEHNCPSEHPRIEVEVTW